MGRQLSAAEAEERQAIKLAEAIERASPLLGMPIAKRQLRPIAEAILASDQAMFNRFEGQLQKHVYPIVVIDTHGDVRIDHDIGETWRMNGGARWASLSLFVSGQQVRDQIEPEPESETIVADAAAEPADEGASASDRPFTILLFMASGHTIKIRGVVEFGWRRGFNGGPFNWLKIVQTDDPTLGRILVPTLRLSDIVGVMQLPGGCVDKP